MASLSFLILAVVPYVCLLAASDDALRVMHNVRAANDNSTCTIEQTKCSSDCSSITTCYQVNNRTYTSTQECTTGTACNPYKKECTSVKATCPVFQCGGEGVFPDLLDCTKYHVCDAKGVDIPGTCQDNHYYDIKTQDCVQVPEDNTKYPSECKTTPVPQCTTTQLTGVLKADKRIYYICGNGQAKLYYCKGGLQFNTDTFECEDNTLACVDAPHFYVDPNNCRKFYYCTHPSTFPQHLSCLDTEHFDINSQKCETGGCKISTTTTSSTNTSSTTIASTTPH